MRSDELAHWGIPGMHWGIRRWQNPDGSLTPEGRIHYGVGKARDAVVKSVVVTGKAAGKVGKTFGRAALIVGKNYARKHMPRILMSDNMLQDSLSRAEAERRYLQAKRDARSLKIGNGRKLFGRILEEGASSIGRKAFEKLGTKIFDREEDYEYLMEHPDQIKSLKELKDLNSWREEFKKLKGSSGVNKQSFAYALSHPDEVSAEDYNKAYNARKNAKSYAQDLKEEANKAKHQKTVKRNRKIGFTSHTKTEQTWSNPNTRSYFINIGKSTANDLIRDADSDWNFF